MITKWVDRTLRKAIQKQPALCICSLTDIHELHECMITISLSYPIRFSKPQTLIFKFYIKELLHPETLERIETIILVQGHPPEILADIEESLQGPLRILTDIHGHNNPILQELRKPNL